MTEELPGEAIYPREGVLDVPRLLPDDRSLWYDFVDLHQNTIRIVQVGVVVRSNLFIERNSGTTGNAKRPMSVGGATTTGGTVPEELHHLVQLTFDSIEKLGKCLFLFRVRILHRG